MAMANFPYGPHAELVLAARYLAKNPEGKPQETPGQMLARVAQAVAAAEENFGGAPEAQRYARLFEAFMSEGRFLPNSPTLMNAGRPLGQLSACFVLPVHDSLESIFEAVKQTALIHKSGGGTGFNFSHLRPAGDVVASTSGVSSGPVSFMTVFDLATEAIKQGGTRRGANMGILSVYHPDLETFITATRRMDTLTNFNVSVLVDDRFMAAAQAGEPWQLRNPHDGRAWRTVEAANLLELIVTAAHASGEPGMLFYDAINRANPTPALGPLEATNPCGEQPLLPHESCNLGSLVLPRFVKNGGVDEAALEEAAALAVRFLDDVIEVNRHPLPEAAEANRRTRKVGLGVMGFADLLVDLGIPYGDEAAAELGRRVMARIQAAGRQASVELGKERGSFPAFAKSIYPAQGLTALRNATVTTVAPTGTLSLLAGVSSGIEPYYALAYTRRVLGQADLVELNPRFFQVLRRRGLDNPENRAALAAGGRAVAIKGLPPAEAALFPTAHEVTPEKHLAIQAAFQAHSDSGVSKTVNLPAAAGPEQVRRVFLRAHELGLKGVTVFRQGCRGRQVLDLAPLPGQEGPRVDGGDRCPRCGGDLATDGSCRVCLLCGASGCE